MKYILKFKRYDGMVRVEWRPPDSILPMALEIKEIDFKDENRFIHRRFLKIKDFLKNEIEKRIKEYFMQNNKKF